MPINFGMNYAPGMGMGFSAGYSSGYAQPGGGGGGGQGAALMAQQPRPAQIFMPAPTPAPVVQAPPIQAPPPVAPKAPTLGEIYSQIALAEQNLPYELRQSTNPLAPGAYDAQRQQYYNSNYAPQVDNLRAELARTGGDKGSFGAARISALQAEGQHNADMAAQDYLDRAYGRQTDARNNYLKMVTTLLDQWTSQQDSAQRYGLEASKLGLDSQRMGYDQALAREKMQNDAYGNDQTAALKDRELAMKEEEARQNRLAQYAMAGLGAFDKFAPQIATGAKAVGGFVKNIFGGGAPKVGAYNDPSMYGPLY